MSQSSAVHSATLLLVERLPPVAFGSDRGFRLAQRPTDGVRVEALLLQGLPRFALHVLGVDVDAHFRGGEVAGTAPVSSAADFREQPGDELLVGGGHRYLISHLRATAATTAAAAAAAAASTVASALAASPAVAPAGPTAARAISFLLCLGSLQLSRSHVALALLVAATAASTAAPAVRPSA